MAGFIPAIHVFIEFQLTDLILRRSRGKRLEGGSGEHWSLLRDADCVCSSG
jgi:hypothetical protein